MTNIISIDDSSSGNENASFSDASLLFRRGFANNTELGFKFMKGSDIGLAVMTDVKWLVIQSPINLAVDLGMSVWRIGGAGWVGYHPSILAGTENFFAVAQYNYIRSPGNVTRTQDILVGKHFKQKDTRYTLTPFIGLHRNEAALENVYYSLGFGFRQPLDKWTFPR